MIYNILIQNITKGDGEMMALFLAQRVVLGKLTFDEIPDVLKPAAYEYLEESGLAFLAGDYQPPTPPTDGE